MGQKKRVDVDRSSATIFINPYSILNPNMKARNTMISVCLLTLIFIVSSCKKDPVEVNDVKSKEVTLSRKTDYGNDWIYYSMVDGKEIDGLDETSSQTSDKWDIAFNRYNVRTNSGASGTGQGGAYDAGKVDWATVIEASESGYTVDSSIEIVEAFTGQGVDMMDSNGNTVFIDCIGLEYGTQGPVYTANEHVYVIKTAKGKYAKLMITSFYNNAGDSGYLAFKYSYQNGDGRKFE